MAIRSADVLDLIATLDVAIYADGDVLFDTQEIPNFFSEPLGEATLTSLQVLDEDDQGIALDLIFLNANVSLGAENGAPSISDANARNIVGRVSIATGDYVDLGGVRVATKSAIAQKFKGVAGTASLWVAGITRGGTPTYTVNGLRLKFGVDQD